MIGGFPVVELPGSDLLILGLAVWSPDSPGNQMVRLAAAMKTAVIERFKLRSAHNTASPIEGFTD
jgi:hypothetical protein